MTLFRKFLILFRTLFFFIRPELYIKQAEAIGPRLFITHIRFPALQPHLPDARCRSSFAPTPSGHRLSRPPSHHQPLRAALPSEKRAPVPAPRCLQGAQPPDGYAILLDNLKQTTAELQNTYANLENVVDPDLIDYYIYQAKAVQMRYKFLLGCVKKIEGNYSLPS